jgi:hypothetical protein
MSPPQLDELFIGQELGAVGLVRSFVVCARRSRLFPEKSDREVRVYKGLALLADRWLSRRGSAENLRGKTMTTENLVEGSVLANPNGKKPPSAGAEIAHELKNCVSVLLLLVEAIEIDRQHPVADEDNIKDLKNLILKMNGLVDRLK